MTTKIAGRSVELFFFFFFHIAEKGRERDSIFRPGLEILTSVMVHENTKIAGRSAELFFFHIVGQLQHTEDYCQLLTVERLLQR